MNSLIKLSNVSKEYKTGNQIVKAANNLNFTIDQGELIVILGPSGSGKSTLLNLLGGLDKPTSGEIIIDNENITNFSDKELTRYRAKEIGFIFQFYNLIPNLTACENIEIMNDVVDKNIDGKEILTQVGLSQHFNKFPSELSGGEQQRVSIARAIAKKPKMLLCDAYNQMCIFTLSEFNMIYRLIYAIVARYPGVYHVLSIFLGIFKKRK